MIIVFAPEHQTFYSLSTMASLSVLIAAFIIAEKPWRDTSTNKQHLVNEVAIYLMMVISFVFTDRSLDGVTADILGQFMIAFAIIVIAYNLYMISLESLKSFRLIYARYINLKKAKLAKLLKEQKTKPEVSVDEDLPVQTERALVTKKTSSDSDGSSKEKTESARSPTSPVSSPKG